QRVLESRHVFEWKRERRWPGLMDSPQSLKCVAANDVEDCFILDFDVSVYPIAPPHPNSTPDPIDHLLRPDQRCSAREPDNSIYDGNRENGKRSSFPNFPR